MGNNNELIFITSVNEILEQPYLIHILKILLNIYCKNNENFHLSKNVVQLLRVNSVNDIL